LSSAIAEAACPHQMVCMVVPDPPCVCDGILRSRDFFGFLLTGSQITCIDWHNTLCAARSGEVSSAFAGGHQLQKTQGSGVSPAVECARQISVLHRLADIFSAVSCPTSDHGAAGRVLRRGTDCATCPHATVSRNPSDLHFVSDGLQCPLCFRPASSGRTAFTLVFVCQTILHVSVLAVDVSHRWHLFCR